MTERIHTPHRQRATLSGRDTEWSRRRLAAGLSLTELAQLSGVPRSVVGLIDQGRMIPSPDEASKLLAVLDHEGAA